MPDRNSVEFWKDCAAAYKNQPGVIFDLYNEPHDVSWDRWLKGGPVTEKDQKTKKESSFEAVGMQELLDVVRATGAMNLVVVGGLDWSYDLSGILPGRQTQGPDGPGGDLREPRLPVQGGHGREVGRQDGDGREDLADHRQRVRLRPRRRRRA